MKPFYVLATAAALMLLGGCAPVFVNSTRDDAATLTVTSEADVKFALSTFANGEECRDSRRLTEALGGLAPKERVEVKIPPGETFTVMGFLSSPSSYCSVVLSFKPLPRATYRALVTGNSASCVMSIHRAENGKLIPEESVRRREWVKPFLSDSEAQCR